MPPLLEKDLNSEAKHMTREGRTFLFYFIFYFSMLLDDPYRVEVEESKISWRDDILPRVSLPPWMDVYPCLSCSSEELSTHKISWRVSAGASLAGAPSSGLSGANVCHDLWLRLPRMLRAREIRRAVHKLKPALLSSQVMGVSDDGRAYKQLLSN